MVKSKNKNKFWRFIKNTKKKRSTQNEINIPPNILHNHYKDFFLDNKDNLTDSQKNLNEKVKVYFDENINATNPQKFKQTDLNSILDDLENSNVRGFDSISYNLIKNSLSENFNTFLEFYNSLLIFKIIPENFNTSIITPIIKDNNKKTDDINNIRPLSISNCFAQIFEKLILVSSPDLNKAHKNQFGFRKNTSCNHALFVTKETILNRINSRLAQ